MSVVMRLGGWPGGVTGFEGQYLKAFDFEALDGFGEITMTPDVAEAKRFRSLYDAVEFYRTRPKCRPIREDGKPNRPLTATTWEFQTNPD